MHPPMSSSTSRQASGGRQQPSPTRHRWLDGFRGAATLRLRALVEDVARRVAKHEHEQADEPRRRRRRPDDARRHATAIETIVANLAHAVLLPPDSGQLAVLTGNALKGHTRYDNPALGKTLRTLLFHLEEIDVLAWTKSFIRGHASSIAPSADFAAQVREAGISLEDFGRLPGEEVILLSRKLRLSGNVADGKREAVDYTDTPDTVAMRQTMQELNAFLAAADITFVDDGEGAVDAHQRTMRRHFVLRPDDAGERFDRSGRLFGGFWQNLRKDRRGCIRIGGEEVAVLDYASMFPRLAYASVGAVPPRGDLYAIPGLEGHRRGVKLAVNCLLFDEHDNRKSWPEDLFWGGGEGQRAELPEGWTVARTRRAILSRHPALAPCLGVGIGFGLMHTESVILTKVLDHLKSQGTVALGLHDGLLVPRPEAETVRDLMVAVGWEVTSTSIPVEIAIQSPTLTPPLNYHLQDP